MQTVARSLVSILGISLVLGAGSIAHAEEAPLPVVRFQDHRFDPSEVVVKAGAPLRLQVVNASSQAIEFESFELNRERVVQPGEAIVVFLPALDPGSYKFFDDFERTAEGTLTAR